MKGTILILALLVAVTSAAPRAVSHDFSEQHPVVEHPLEKHEMDMDAYWIKETLRSTINWIKNTLFPTFKKWADGAVSQIKEKLQLRKENLKQLAILFLKQMARAAIDAVIKEGYKFFEEHKSEIGTELWKAIEKLYRDHLEGKLTMSETYSELDQQEYNWIKEKLSETIAKIKSSFGKFKIWIAEQLEKLKENVQTRVENIKLLAESFAKRLAKAAIEGVLEEGYKFFKEHQLEIGLEVWTKIDKYYQDHLKSKLQ